MKAPLEDLGRALVTGTRRGIGHALVGAFVARGIDVIATMREPVDPALFVELGDRVQVACLNVDDPSTIDIPDDVGIVVNNAGSDEAYLPVEHADIESWRRLMETNLFGLLEVSRRAVPVLRARGGGVICNITSASLLVGMPFYGAYRASKAAASALTDSLRAEVAPFGIRVVEVLPGPVRTDMLAASARVPEAAAHDGYEVLASQAHAGRMAVDDMSVSAGDAAHAIVEAAINPTGPTVMACDPLGEQLLAGWRADPLGMR